MNNIANLPTNAREITIDSLDGVEGGEHTSIGLAEISKIFATHDTFFFESISLALYSENQINQASIHGFVGAVN